MSIATKIRAAFETAIGGDHTGVGATYATLGSPTTHTAQSIVISSSFNQSIFLSIDGTNNHIFVIAGSTISLDVSGNKQGATKLGLPVGTQFYIKQGPDGAPSSGDIFISILYGR